MKVLRYPLRGAQSCRCGPIRLGHGGAPSPRSPSPRPRAGLARASFIQQVAREISSAIARTVTLSMNQASRGAVTAMTSDEFARGQFKKGRIGQLVGAIGAGLTTVCEASNKRVGRNSECICVGRQPRLWEAAVDADNIAQLFMASEGLEELRDLEAGAATVARVMHDQVPFEQVAQAGRVAVADTTIEIGTRGQRTQHSSILQSCCHHANRRNKAK